MRISECEVILPVIKQAIGAIDAAFERERQSREIAADFEREYERLTALPENISREVKSELPSVVQDEQKARVPMSRPRIENFYPWLHHARLAAQSLSKPDWAHAAEAIDDELRKLPKHPIDWTQPGVFDELREEIQEVGNRVRDILMSCVAEMESQASKSEEGVELPFGYVPNVLPKVVEWAKDIGEYRRLECKDPLSKDDKAFMRTVKQRFNDNPVQQAAAVEHWECHLSKQSDSSAQ
jgi:hypothetical protein